MPSYKHTKPSSKNLGDPSGTGQSKAGAKPVDPNQTRAEHDELEDRYTNGPDSPAEGIRINNPNRNLNKPDIDRGIY